MQTLTSAVGFSLQFKSPAWAAPASQDSCDLQPSSRPIQCVDCRRPSWMMLPELITQAPGSMLFTLSNFTPPQLNRKRCLSKGCPGRLFHIFAERIRQSWLTQIDLPPYCHKAAMASFCSERGHFQLTDQAQLRLNMQVFDCEAMLYFQHFIQWLSARPGCAGCACQGVMDIGSFPPVVARLSPTTRGRACATGVRQQ